MSRNRRSSYGAPRTSRSRWIGLALACVAVASVLLGGRPLAVWTAHRAAAAQIRSGAIGTAEERLAWCDWVNAGDSRTELLRAACYREFGDEDRWQAAFQAAQRAGASADELHREERLAAIRWALVENFTAQDFAALVDSGASPRETATALVYGLIALERPSEAEKLLAAWQPTSEEEAHACYLRGALHWSQGDHQSAQAALERALELEPRHEPARFSLAQLLDEGHDLEASLFHYAALSPLIHERETVKRGLARLLRRLGKLEQARNLLLPRETATEVSSAAAIELGQIENEAGNFNQARQWFERARRQGAEIGDMLRGQSSIFALQEDTHVRALFTQIEEAQARTRQTRILERRLALEPEDDVAADELRALSQSSDLRRGDRDSAAIGISPLYLEKCAVCHGADGDGRGRAARHLFPRPRDFRSDPLRLVSTYSGVPTQEDVEAVIRRGMPGTAMPAFEELSDQQRSELAEQVLQFRRAGLRKRLFDAWRSHGRDAAEGELELAVARLSQAGEVLSVPSLGPPDSRAIARGKEVYFHAGCHACHGADGTGASQAVLFDERGWPMLPRDLVHDPMKGGSEPESLYRRIRLGMPGTSHPASPTLAEEQLIDLVHYCGSLSQEAKRELTNYERVARALRLNAP